MMRMSGSSTRPKGLSFLAAASFGMSLFAAGAVKAATKRVELNASQMFAPASITVQVGDSVTWRNASTVVHTVTDDPQLASNPEDSTLPAGAQPFNSGFLKAGQTFSHEFKAAGTYRYFCILHESAGMVGTIIVKAE